MALKTDAALMEKKANIVILWSYNTSFYDTFKKITHFESFLTSHQTIGFDQYGYHHVFKIIVDGNCSVSVLVVPVFFCMRSRLRTRVTHSDGKHISFHQQQL
jgi:hypothetical protein